jgi:hypothetical protein
MKPLFLLQIVRSSDGAVAQLPAGGALEANLVDLLTTHILSKGVSFKSKKHVERDVREGISQAIMSLKEQTTQITVLN